MLQSLNDLRIYLASQSPRRQVLLQQLNLRYEVLTVEVDESVLDDEASIAYVKRLALEKALAGWGAPLRKNNWPVLGADTAVVLNGRILGKPRDHADAMNMLQSLSGETHQVLTAVAAVVENKQIVALSQSDVEFCVLSESLCDAYWQTGEPADKAGAYAIQGLGATFVKNIRGSYSGIVGLPLYETVELLKNL